MNQESGAPREPEGASNILVVDDTVENLKLLSKVLSEHGYEVRPVTSGRLALQAIAHTAPDLVLLDVNMPEMNGYEVCARIREQGLTDVPIIFLTALLDTRDKLRAFEAGGADYITKPFQIEEVLARVRVHLSLRRTRRELEANYERLRSLERLRDDLVHMVVHDMRSPLAVLMANLEFIESDAGEAFLARSRVDLRAAIGGAAALNRMANDLLDVSRLEAGKLPVERSATDLALIAEDVRSRFAGLDRERTIELDAPEPVECLADAGLVRRVVENLVFNAIKHTPRGRQVRIATARTERGVRLAVTDDGPGMPPEVRARVFDKFGAVEVRQENQFHSAGLGLAFCRLAIEAHGGVIGVDAGTPRGSVFWLELPVS